MMSKIQKNGRILVDQAAIAGCAAGSFENIAYVDQVAKAENRGLGMFPLNIYPASQPVLTELNRDGISNDLMTEGVRIKTAFRQLARSLPLRLWTPSPLPPRLSTAGT